MPPSSLVAFLRRVCIDDYGYNLALPVLTVSTLALSQTVIRRISFTEIDFQTYVAQAALFLDGERDYAKLDPQGGSGPCVYPPFIFTSTRSSIGLQTEAPEFYQLKCIRGAADRHQPRRRPALPTSRYASDRRLAIGPIEAHLLDLPVAHVQRSIRPFLRLHLPLRGSQCQVEVFSPALQSRIWASK